MKRDVFLLFLTKIVRTFSYGFLGVLFPIYLTSLGADAPVLGIAITLTLLCSAAFTYGIRQPGETYGIKPVLLTLSLMTLFSAILFLLFKNPIGVIAAAMLGNLAVGTGETGPFLSLEQVLLSREVSREKLTTAMSLYNLVGYVAAALGASFVGQFGNKSTLFFILFLCGSLVQLLLYSFLGSERLMRKNEIKVLEKNNESLIRKIATLFALDSFAGGFILQSIVIYWFQQKFDLKIHTLGWISFGTQLLSGLSFLMAPSLSKKIGLVNAMVFSHLISNFLLIGVGFAPTAPLAITFLFLRHLLSQIDVPTRQTFLMLAVEDSEREKAASVTNMSRTLSQAVSPALTGWILQCMSLSTPFLIGGSLKALYDLSLYISIRRHKIHHSPL